ncbi:MAG: hypothetical protein LBE22_03880 [Azoarcus sp.]|jgi:hypothetical protein|nr:hypothetical protein [Azoarcus sp.]
MKSKIWTDSVALIRSIFLLLLLCGTSCFGQDINGTFQGQIEWLAPAFLQIEAKGGAVTGYYVYPPGKVLVPLKGSLDKNGNLKITAKDKPFPAFSGKLDNRVIRGNFKASQKEKPKSFYAVNFSEEYRSCENNASLMFSLTHNGYAQSYCPPGGSCSNPCHFSTHTDSEGRIFLRCDKLNTHFYLQNDSIVVDENSDFATQIYQSDSQKECDGRLVFRHNKYEEEIPVNRTSYFDLSEIRLNKNYSIRLRQVSESEYKAQMLVSAHMRHKPYLVIKDVAVAQKLLGDRFKVLNGIENQTSAENYEITFNDNHKLQLTYAYGYIAYFPEVGVLLFDGGHSSDLPIDLNDSVGRNVENPGFHLRSPDTYFPLNNEFYLNVGGNPYYHLRSPDNYFRFNGYYHGQDWSVLFLEKWNESKKKYEIINYLDYEYSRHIFDDRKRHFNENDEYQTFSFRNSEGWFWVSNRKMFFKNVDSLFYEMEIVDRKR